MKDQLYKCNFRGFIFLSLQEEKGVYCLTSS